MILSTRCPSCSDPQSTGPVCDTCVAEVQMAMKDMKDRRSMCFKCRGTYVTPTADRCLCHICNTYCGICRPGTHFRPRRREAVLATRRKT